MNRFRRVALATLVVAAGVSGWQSVARAQVYQPYWNARPVTDASPAMGAVVGFGDNMFRIAGHGRFSMTSASDLGLELVFDNFEADNGDDSQSFGFGGDFKYLFVPDGPRLPFDFAGQACFGMEFGDDVTSLFVPFGVLGSKSIPVDSGSRMVTPFAGMYAVVTHTSVDTPAGDASDTDVDVEVRFGSAFQIAGQTHAFAALHVGNGTMFFLGFTAGL